MTRVVFRCFCTVLGLLAPLTVGAATWRNIGPEGGTITALATDPAGRTEPIVLASSSDLFRGTNGGAGWHAASTFDEWTHRAVSPEDNGRLFAWSLDGRLWGVSIGEPQWQVILPSVGSLVVDRWRVGDVYASSGRSCGPPVASSQSYPSKTYLMIGLLANDRLGISTRSA